MRNPEIWLGLIILGFLLFGAKRMPDAARGLGRSLRIFKGEMKGMKDDDVRTKDPATTTPVRGEVVNPAPAGTDDLSTQLLEEARLAEARAAELRARADQVRPAEAPSAEGPR
jgi:sec-independent protein translocase protein TatA